MHTTYGGVVTCRSMQPDRNHCAIIIAFHFLQGAADGSKDRGLPFALGTGLLTQSRAAVGINNTQVSKSVCVTPWERKQESP